MPTKNPKVEVRQGDTLPYLDFTLVSDTSDTPHNLSGATVTFSMIDDNGDSKIQNGACTIVGAATGEVRYSFAAADTDTAGIFYGEFQVVFSSGKKLSFPEGEYIRITITPELDA